MTGSRDTMELHGDNLGSWEMLKTSIFKGPRSYLLFQGGQATPDDVRDALDEGSRREMPARSGRRHGVCLTPSGCVCRWLHFSPLLTTYVRARPNRRRRREAAPSSRREMFSA